MNNKKSLIKNEKANANIIILAIFTVIMGFGMLIIGPYLYFAVATSADAGTQIASRGTNAAGTFAFNGSNFSSDGSTGTLTSVTITRNGAIYIFEFNTTTLGSPSCQTPNCILIANVNTNNSIGGATNLTTVINANTSVATFLSAARTADTVGLTYLSRTTDGNSVVLTRTITPVGQDGWIAAAGLSGGLNDVTGQASQNALNNYVGITFPLMGLALMILGFGVIFVTLKGAFGGAGRKE